MNRCIWCQKEFNANLMRTKEHLVPKCLKKRVLNNIKYACGPCNNERGIIPNFYLGQLKIIKKMESLFDFPEKLEKEIEHFNKNAIQMKIWMDKWEEIEISRLGWSPSKETMSIPWQINKDEIFKKKEDPKFYCTWCQKELNEESKKIDCLFPPCLGKEGNKTLITCETCKVDRNKIPTYYFEQSQIIRRIRKFIENNPQKTKLSKYLTKRITKVNRRAGEVEELIGKWLEIEMNALGETPSQLMNTVAWYIEPDFQTIKNVLC